ncbi:MAG TPA: hypothetical protein VFL92_04080 [Sphingomonas sp.]|nr:hypothetical protein [Sphingomonas sp.]
MKSVGIALAGLWAVASFTSPAASAPAPIAEAPSASVRVLNAASADLNWYGKGDLVAKSQLCVASTTGRYRLQVMLTSPAKPGVTPPFTIDFHTTTGDSGSQKSTNGGVLFFDGRTLEKGSCAGAANATIEVRFDQSSLTAAIAGQYLTQLQISVSPT